jgi:hypothetical protein
MAIMSLDAIPDEGELPEAHPLARQSGEAVSRRGEP